MHKLRCEGDEMNKGTICVARSVSGEVQWLRLDPQWHYKEWSGCFSLIEDVLSAQEQEQEERDRIDIDRWLAEQDVNYE